MKLSLALALVLGNVHSMDMEYGDYGRGPLADERGPARDVEPGLHVRGSTDGKVTQGPGVEKSPRLPSNSEKNLSGQIDELDPISRSDGPLALFIKTRRKDIRIS
eukprot:Trichotokara_eunicae@DN5090_c0_g1_i2.p1